MLELDSRAGTPPAHTTQPMRLHAMDAWVRTPSVLTEAGELTSVLHAAAAAGGATVVGERFYTFPNGAVTGVLLLAQSHLSIHTWPELALVNVDLLSCGDIDGEVVLRTIRVRLGVERANVAASTGRLTEERRIVREVADAVGLAEGERGVRAVLGTLARLEPVSTRGIARATDLPVPIVAAVCGELRKRSIVAEERPTRLTPAGRELYSRGGLRLGGTAACPACKARGIVVAGELSPLVRELSKAVRGGPPPGSSSISATARSIRSSGASSRSTRQALSSGRRILLLGDDDLTALALKLLVLRHGSRRTIASVAVVDVDPALVSFLEHELADAPFPVTCVEHDLRRPLPPELTGGFDTVVTDPPYTTAAARLFLSRAARRSAMAAATCSSRSGRGGRRRRCGCSVRSPRSAS